MKYTYLPSHIQYFIKIYLIGLILFFLNRIAFFVINYNKSISSGFEFFSNSIISILFYGIRFDLVILSYILAIPILIFSIYYLIKIKPQKALIKATNLFVISASSISLFIWSIDIPYYKFFNNRINTSAFNWLNDGDFAIKMIMSDFSMWGYLILFVLSILLFLFLFIKLIKFNNIEINSNSIILRIIIVLVFLSSVFLLIRGRISTKSPIREGTAFYCNDNFFNYLGLNPTFSLISSLKYDLKSNSENIELINDSIAILNVKRFYNSDLKCQSSPICRIENNNNSQNNKNVIVILMENMSIYNTEIVRNEKSLTPFIDSLGKCSKYYTNLITCGTHTFNGIYSTLFSFPTIFNKHPLKTLMDKHNIGLANILSKHNYRNLFFLTHDSQFDNIGGFLLKNGFSTIISEEQYNKDAILSNLGVSDHIMFDYGINTINKVASANIPFLSVFLTSSNHKPYIIPKCEFNSNEKNLELKIIEYSDWALNKFFNDCKKQSWFDNTIFIFLADHGNGADCRYEIPISYIKSPLIIYYNGVIPETENSIISQVDIQPTIYSLLQIDFQNNTFGFNINAKKRDFALFSNEKYIACIDSNYVYFYKKDKSEYLYNYKTNSRENIARKDKEIYNKMREYTLSNFQFYQWIIKTNSF